jgi:hypothetical protein
MPRDPETGSRRDVEVARQLEHVRDDERILLRIIFLHNLLYNVFFGRDPENLVRNPESGGNEVVRGETRPNPGCRCVRQVN